MATQRRPAATSKKPSAGSGKSSTKSSARSAAQSSTGKTAKKSAKSAKRPAATQRPAAKSSARAPGSAGGIATRDDRRTKGAARKSQKPNAIDLLIEDHRQVQKLFRKAERLDAGDPQLKGIIERACGALAEHAQIEEDVFYPAVREQADAEDIIAEAEIEHDVAKQLIAQLQDANADDERTKAMFKVLGEYVNHHIEEEEKEMFRAAKRAKIDMAALGEQITMRKEGGDSVGTRSSAGESAIGRDDVSDDANGDSRTRSSRSEVRDSTESASADEDEEVDVETPGRASGRSSPRRASH